LKAERKLAAAQMRNATRKKQRIVEKCKHFPTHLFLHFLPGVLKNQWAIVVYTWYDVDIVALPGFALEVLARSALGSVSSAKQRTPSQAFSIASQQHRKTTLARSF